MDPITLEAWETITSLVFLLILSLISIGFIKPSFEELTKSILILSKLEHSNNGLKTELCSKVVEITWSFSFKIPLIRIFKEEVILLVKIHSHFYYN